jgi:hypothetical protein
MKKLLLVMGLCCAPVFSKPVVLKEGIPLALTVQERLVSGEVPEGSRVTYKVERDVLDSTGKVLIAAGSLARGKVVKSEGSGFFGRSGALNISVENVDAVDGSLVLLRSLRDSTGNDQEDAVIIGGVLLSVFFIFMEGDDVRIEPGTLITAFVDRDTTINKPAPAKLSAAELKLPRKLAITSPAAAAHVQKQDKLVVSNSLSPDDPQAIVRLYWDRRLVTTQRGSAGRIEWDTRPYDKFVQAGQHTLESEVTTQAGLILKSEPVTIQLDD